jgi:serine/threonine protein kinase
MEREFRTNSLQEQFSPKETLRSIALSYHMTTAITKQSLMSSQVILPTSSIESTDVERWMLQAQLSEEYQVVRELGRGGMGVIFLARDVALHRLVAIKVLRHEYAHSAEHRERFRREARVAARLTHPNVVAVHSYGESPDLVYLVMRYVHGESLGVRLRREGRLKPDVARRMLADLALVLEYAHREGIVHRDLKPENILLESGTDRPLLTDFGVALIRSADPSPDDVRRAFGTPQYMSPEQAAGEVDLDGRSDIYSLGVLAYAMLTGDVPFDGPSFGAIAAQHIAAPHAPLAEVTPHVPHALAEVVEWCLEKERGARWQNARELHNALQACERGARGWFRRSAVTLRGLGRTRVAAALAIVAAALKQLVVRWPGI